MSNLKTISPDEAAALVRDGAVLIDIREAAEHANEKRAIMPCRRSTPNTRHVKATPC